MIIQQVLIIHLGSNGKKEIPKTVTKISHLIHTKKGNFEDIIKKYQIRKTINEKINLNIEKDDFYDLISPYLPNFILSLSKLCVPLISKDQEYRGKINFEKFNELKDEQDIISNITDIILLLIKKFKKSHFLRSYYIVKLVFDANGLNILLKILQEEKLLLYTLESFLNPSLKLEACYNYTYLLNSMRIIQKLLKEYPYHMKIFLNLNGHVSISILIFRL